MKKILISIIITFGFIHTEEWIYFNNMTDYEWGSGMDFSVTKVKPDGSEHEIILEDVKYSDLSNDGTKILYINQQQLTLQIYNIETMETISSTNEIPPALYARFTQDENEILFMSGDQYASALSLYKYSFLNSSVSLISDSLSMGIYNMTLSPDGENVVYFKMTEDENSEDYFMDYDVMITHIETGETIVLTTIPYLDFNSLGIWDNNPYWSDNGFIYLTFLDDNGCSQLFAIHSSIGYITQITNNPCLNSINYFCFGSILGTQETDLDKFIYNVCDEYVGSNVIWMYDIESDESTYILDFIGENYVSISMDQSWSPDGTKVSFSEYLYGGMIAVPGYMRIYDTVTESIDTVGNILNMDDPESYYVASPINWIEDGLAGDVNGDSLLNVQDIVIIVNMIMAGENNSSADYNGDGVVNILDIVAIVQVIMSN